MINILSSVVHDYKYIIYCGNTCLNHSAFVFKEAFLNLPLSLTNSPY